MLARLYSKSLELDLSSIWTKNFRMYKLSFKMKQELPDVQAGFQRGRGNRDQIANIPWIMEKAG